MSVSHKYGFFRASTVRVENRCDLDWVYLKADIMAMIGSKRILRDSAADIKDPPAKKSRRKGCAPTKPKEQPAGFHGGKHNVYTFSELCNEAVLRDLASRHRAATWHPSPNGPSLRKMISDMLYQVHDGELRTVFWEEKRMVKLCRRGRRYSGYKRDEDEPDEYFEKFMSSNISPGSIGRSWFGLPGWLRDLARAGLKDCYVLDMVNAHPYIQHRRHPTLSALREYVEDREAVLASVPCSRKAAKQLFIRIVYGGQYITWCAENKVNPNELPDIVARFQSDQKQVALLDAAENPELLETLAEGEPGRHHELLQYVLNTEEERRVIDAVAFAVRRMDGRILALEHDGLFICSTCSEEELLRETTAAAGYPLTIKACCDIDPLAAWAELYKKSKCDTDTAQTDCSSAWEVSESTWEASESIAREAAGAPLTSHDIFAKLLVTEPAISEELPWPLTDLFKLPLVATNYVWYDAPRHVWVEGGPNGASRLRAYITLMLQRRLSPYEIGDNLEVTVRRRTEFGNKSFREGVESCLRELLFVDQSFILDPETSLRYLNFDDGTAWDRETESWVRTRPDMLISRTTNWTFTECTNPAIAKVDEALALVRASQDERGLHLPSLVPDSAARLLDEARQDFPELQFWYDFTREWEGVLYELTHAARGLFGILMAEALYVRGSGRNGKDTACNAFKAVGGGYVHSIAASSLCQISDPNAPSPVFAGCRGRRIVCIREVPKDCKILEGVYKSFTDPTCVIQGRNLYEHLVQFSPQYLAFFASNGPIPVAMDCAVRERTAIVDHVSIFRDHPTECNDLQWKDMSRQRLESYRPGFLWIFMRIYHHLLKGRSSRNVCPVPVGSLQQKALDCADPGSQEFEQFLRDIKPARGPKDASTKEEIEAHAANVCAVSLSGVSIYLNGKGFLKVRRDRGLLRNLYFYQYTFPMEGDAKSPQLVKLVCSET